MQVEEELLDHQVTTLMRAVAINNEEGNILVTKLLATSSVDIFAVDSKGRTALDWARLCKNIVAVKLLQKVIDDYILEQRVAGYTTGENSAKSKSLQFRERNNTGTGLNSRDGVFARIEGVDHSSSEEDEVDDNMKAIKVLIARGKNKLPFLRDDDN